MAGPTTRSKARAAAEQFKLAAECKPMQQVLRTPDLLTMVLKFLPKESLEACALVSRYWKNCMIKAVCSSCVSNDGPVQIFLRTLSLKLISYPYQRQKILVLTRDPEKEKLRSFNNLMQAKSNLLEVKGKVALTLASLEDDALIDSCLADTTLPDFFESLSEDAKTLRAKLQRLQLEFQAEPYDYYKIKEFCTSCNVAPIWFSAIKTAIELGATGLAATLMIDGGDCILEVEELEVIAGLIYQIKEEDFVGIRIDFLQINNIEFSNIIAKKMADLAMKDGNALECFKIAYRYLSQPRGTLFVEELQETRTHVKSLFNKFSTGADTRIWFEQIVAEVEQDPQVERLVELLNLEFFQLTDEDIASIAQTVQNKFSDFLEGVFFEKAFLDFLTDKDLKLRFTAYVQKARPL